MVKLLGDSVTQILRQIINQKSTVLAEIIINWPKIVGVELANLVQPLRIFSISEKGTKINVLLLLADSSASGMKLSYQQEVIVERIAIYFGHKAVHKIKVTTNM